MEFFVFLVIILFIFALIGSEKKPKPAKVTRNLRAGGRGDASAEGYPSSWQSYEEAERGEGMQDDLDPSKLYEVSKARLETARKAAAKTLSYKGLPTATLPRAKNKGRVIETSNSLSKGQPPLLRDMNLQRRIFLSGGRNNTFGERQKTRGGTKTLLVFSVLGVVAAYILRASFG